MSEFSLPRAKGWYIYPLTPFTPWLRVAPWYVWSFIMGLASHWGFGESHAWDGQTEMQLDWGGTVAHIRTVQHLCCWNQRKWHGTPKVSATSLLLSIFRSIFALHKIHSVASFLSSWLADSYQNDLSQESKCSKQMFLVATCVKAVIDIHLLHHRNWYTWQNTVINHCTGEHRYPYIRQALPLYSKCLF